MLNPNSLWMTLRRERDVLILALLSICSGRPSIVQARLLHHEVTNCVQVTMAASQRTLGLVT